MHAGRLPDSDVLDGAALGRASPGARLAPPKSMDGADRNELARTGASGLLVVEGGRLVGPSNRLDVARWIELHVKPPVRAHAR
jgi:hypothetical protein